MEFGELSTEGDVVTKEVSSPCSQGKFVFDCDQASETYVYFTYLEK